MSSIYKKVGKHTCDNYRELSGVILTIARIFGRVTKNKIQKNMMNLEEQSGFKTKQR